MKPPIQAKNAKQPLGLTVAEAECIRTYIECGNQKLVARRMDVSINTVRTLMLRARNRVGCENHVQFLIDFDRADREKVAA